MTTPQQPQHGAAPQQFAAPAAPPQGHGPQHAPLVDAAPPQGAPAHGQVPQAQGGLNAGYTSPIPVRPTHLGHALASEWAKIRSVRSTVWTLGVMFVLVVGIGLLTAVGLSGSGTYTGIPLLAPGFFGLMLGQICVITLGVLVVTSEYGTGMIRTTLTACPNRSRVLLAKAIVFFLLAFVMTTAACLITALINSVMLSGQRVPPTLAQGPLADSVVNGELIANGSEWLGSTVGAALYVALLGLLSLSVGAMLRHSAGAITVMLAVVLLPLVMALFMVTESLQPLREVLMEYSPLNGLASMYGIPMQGDMGATGWPLLGVLALVTAAATAGSHLLIWKRDV
ncbi:ABC transporter permease [Streptomyces sp. HNM0574]|uniref:ABC transporter permease n=1 Tax=Streptomyces sp. HNM0574 TaxID=2714954 RepID=UPI0019D1BFAB|nr:ABC transporter permease [Streptomyces sp. HNM0574]